MEAQRLITAVLANLDAWIEAIEEIERNANPGNKIRALHLVRNMYQCRLALQKIALRAKLEGSEPRIGSRPTDA